MKNVIKIACISVFFVTPALLSAKPYPAGIINLPGSVDALHPIGPIDFHPWQHKNVDGMRIRTGWKDVEIAEGVYHWKQIDECLALAARSGKFIGLGVVSGVKAPAWLMGGDSFEDGSTTIDVAKLTSQSANFVPQDVGRVIYSDKFPAGTTIVSRISGAIVKTSAPALATKPGNLPFAILGSRPGVKFHTLTAPDEGVMPIPWDPVVKHKWKQFIIALGARYDSNPNLRYINMGGFQQTGECYLATQPPDIRFFNANAVAEGYSANETLPAGLVAWEATVKEMVDTYAKAFPHTPLFITLARPYPAEHGGVHAINEIVAWGVAKYPGRFGIMNAQLHASSSPGYFANAAIYENRFTQPTGVQFLCSSGSDDNVKRLSNCGRYGSDPCLTPYQAMNRSLKAAIQIGCRFVETYEPDVVKPGYEAMLADYSKALKANP